MKIKSSELRQKVLSMLLEGRKFDAARILWPWLAINEQTIRIWTALDQNPQLCVMGHASASKTFTGCAWFLLDWWTYPHKTATVVTSATLISIRPRAWADLSRLWGGARIRMPGIVSNHRMAIMAGEADAKHGLMCMAADGKDTATKIQGLHTERVRVVIDEADNPFSNSIWKALANLKTSGEFRAAALANPEDRNSQFGVNCEPEPGWSDMDIDTDHEWVSATGWKVLRLDGLRSPNIVAKEDKFQFLLTNAAVESIRKEFGEQSSAWSKYIRAWFAPEGSISTVFSQDIVNRMVDKAITFYGSTQRIAALDPSFTEGGDRCVLSFGNSGFLAEDPSRACLVVDRWVSIKRQDRNLETSIDYAHQVKALCESEGVKPEFFGIDSTNGQSMADYLKQYWSKKILCVPFGGAPSDRKILVEDSKPCDERFDKKVTELWWAAREWGRVGCLSLLNPPRDMRVQMEARRYKTVKEIRFMESKKDMKARGLHSPDEADTLAILVEVMRSRLMIGKQTALTEKQLQANRAAKLPGKAFGARVLAATYGVTEENHE